LFYSSAIKTGRYTYAKKAKDIMEVKGLKEQPVVCPESELARSSYNRLFRTAEDRTFFSGRKRTFAHSELSVYELDEVIQQITAAQARVTFWTPDVLAKQAEREKHYLVTFPCFIVSINHRLKDKFTF
jgi:reverse gyrase